MIPAWKVRREILRFQQQIAWYWELAQARRRTRQHDEARPQMVRRQDGTQPLGARVAALLIFQPGDLPGSIPETCDLLTGLGYSVLVVSNGPLMPAARGALLPHVWRLLERPNLGYDFGGYREAVMHLWDERVEPEELLILNDSVWVIPAAFPAFLDRLGGMGADLSGAVLRSKKGRRWLESYFFRVNRTALRLPAFRSFWQEYRLVDSKFGVIRQGERDFTVALGSAGASVAALGDNAGFLARMAEAPDDELRLALTYAAPVSGPLADERADLLARNADSWRARVLAHLARVLTGGAVWNSQFPVAALRVMGYPFLKKSREPVNSVWRAQVLRAIQDGVVPPPGTFVLDELRAQQEKGAAQSPHWMSRPPRKA